MSELRSKMYKYKPKYLWRKYSRRFKKASLQKKFGYIILMVSFFLAVGLFTKFALIDPLYADGETVTIEKTTRAPIPAKPVVPKVETGYELNDTARVGNSLTGFTVRLPKIVSDAPALQTINAEIEAVKEDIKTKYAAAGNLNNYGELYDYSYSTFSNDFILFISIYKHIETAGIPAISNTYYVYNFAENILVEEYDLATLFNFSEMQMLDIINTKLSAIGATAIDSTDGVELAVNKRGRLSAKVFVEKGAQGKIPVDVELA